MSSGWKRYGEARLYLIAGSAALLVVLWAALVAQDQADSGDTQRESAAESRSSSAAPHTVTRGS
jgi:hypothetical protein